MLSKLNELQNTIVDFIHQDRYQVLVIRLDEAELLYVLKTIETLDQQEQAHVFGLFPQPVAGNADEYVRVILTSLQAQVDPVNQLRVADGHPSWPAFPAECSDARILAARRLRAGVA